ncbi:Holliday junction branch migration protein RuvA [Candidatus Peregrinibacteria bacterium CG11_big_fil_rev_8_21_14_0_20_41_10]|nr:MAG: Holliday junction branch migration protein RuvA [Candidatus Peregrinibacteria bacterium CG11_big_fil_rev_8_21_14_0_20_41_10]PIZ73928.1 MAG: Holliday junction branch migration protein RuvA [Candidatus Peregrinibacteria bacterium CG_4_10_14_0_2_um_filter_41_8]PJC37892.1 MAG: Holliday junction branch migration protein RuvA [Candidatus Peregrinibacteria bacterium CG_4_9_14_0_2_um_filter_41_14]
MIGYLKGKIVHMEARTITILTGSGVGYRVFAPQSLLSAQDINMGNEVELYIYTHFRQDTFELYGFMENSTLIFFESLISINGVGPKLAMDILAAPIHKVQEAIQAEDTRFLQSIKGLGKKTSERMILELKGKLPKFLHDRDENTVQVSDDIIEALLNLGYKRRHVDLVLEKLPADLEAAEDIIKFFLQNV